MKNNLSTEEQLFLDLFLSNGLQPSKKTECYRLAFEEDSKNISDNSCETYAKRILARAESKAYLNERKVSNSQASMQLVQQIKYLDNMLNARDLKPMEEVSVLKEKRLSLMELSKLIEIIKPSAGAQNQYYISDFCLTVDLGELQDYKEDLEGLFDIVQTLVRRGSFLAVDEDGRIKQMLFSTQSGDGSKEIKKAIEAGKYKVAVERSEQDE